LIVCAKIPINMTRKWRMALSLNLT
jgi:hypothetical protein